MTAPDPVLADLVGALSARLVGRTDLVERLAVALIAAGHVLLEGAPGVAKTRAVKHFAAAVEGSFSRIQCTPDLLPADITGSQVFHAETGEFRFVPGPVFHDILLVDEINRAPPKVQSALLEAMAERQVTVGGVTRALGDPFMVIATQNPIDHEGTYPLPLAQLDRFLLHVVVPLPDHAAERAILDLVEAEDDGVAGLPRLSRTALAGLRAAAAGVHLSEAVKDYLVRLVLATRAGGPAGSPAAAIAHPASPRASIGLAKAGRALALVRGRNYVIPADIADLAGDVMAHRIGLTWAAQAEGRGARAVVADLLATVPVL